MYRLHGFSQSGNTFKVAFFLRVLRQPWEAVFVDFLLRTVNAKLAKQHVQQIRQVTAGLQHSLP